MWEGELMKGLLWGSKASVSLLLLISRFNLHSTVGAVSAATVLGGLVDNDAGDDEILNVQALGLQHIPKYIYIFFRSPFLSFIYLSVSLSVLQEVNNVLDRLDGPATLGGLEFLGLGGTADTTVKAAEGNALLLLGDILQVGIGLVQLHTLNGSSNFVGILELYIHELAYYSLHCAVFKTVNILA